MTVEPGARAPVPHYHENWDEAVYGLAGTLLWRIDGREVGVGAGRRQFIPAARSTVSATPGPSARPVSAC